MDPDVPGVRLGASRSRVTHGGFYRLGLPGHCCRGRRLALLSGEDPGGDVSASCWVEHLTTRR